MTLPLGGKEAARSFEKFVNSLLPKDFMKNVDRAKIRERRQGKKGKVQQGNEQQDIGDYFKQIQFPVPIAPIDPSKK